MSWLPNEIVHERNHTRGGGTSWGVVAIGALQPKVMDLLDPCKLTITFRMTRGSLI